MFGCTDRVAFYIGSYPVMKYGITMGIAIAVSVLVLFQIRKKFYYDIDENTVSDLSFRLIVAGIIGARFWYVLLNLGYFANHISEIIMINHGGISIQGALFGGILAGYLYVKKHKLNFFKLADMYAVVLPLGQSIGRWGNFFNSEAFGLPCNYPWRLFIPAVNRPVDFVNYEYFHPTFLYESVLDFLIFLLLLCFFRPRLQNKNGAIFFLYFILYSCVRFVIEFIRIDSVLNIGFMPIAALVCIFTLIFGAIGLFLVLKYN